VQKLCEGVRHEVGTHLGANALRHLDLLGAIEQGTRTN
jgi:hypothetical protein